MLTALQTSGLAVHVLEVEASLDRAAQRTALLKSLEDVELQRRSSLENLEGSGSPSG
jgi:hypothetical protein